MRGPTLVAAVAVVAGIGLQSGVAGGSPASPRQGHARGVTQLQSSGKAVGRLAVVTNSQRLELVDVRANGATGTPDVVGPVTTATSGAALDIEGLVSSDDGHWLAWNEVDQKPNGREVHSTLVLRHMTSGRTITLKTEQQPFGFAADTLVTTEAAQDAFRLSLSPTPHLIKIKLPKQAFQVLAVARHGVSALYIPRTPHANTITQRVITVAFNGQVTTVHRYPPISGDAAPIEDGWSSSDGEHLVIEHGDHTDFGGVGPSSRADELNPNRRSTPSHLGHPGAASAQWRMEQTTFAGQADHIYTVWMTEKSGAPRPVVYRDTAAGWRLVAKHALVVAGSRTGYVAIQPGAYVQDPNIDFPAFDVHAKGHALLIRGSARHRLDVGGTQFAWL
jgi:hypothetical protein